MMRRIAAALVVNLVLAQVAPAQTPEPSQPDREITHIQGGLYRVRDGRQHTIFLMTPEGIVLVDPMSTATARWLKAELELRFPSVPVRYVLATHHHFTRSEGLGTFAGAELVGQDRYNEAANRARRKLDVDLAALDRDDSSALDAQELAASPDRTALLERDRNGDRKVTPRELYVRVSSVGRQFDRRWRIVLGKVPVEMVHVGYTQSPEMSVILFPSERLAFAADVPPLALQNGFGHHSPRDARAWAGAVNALTFDTLLTSDGRSVPHADITAFNLYVRDLLNIVADGYEAGRTAASLQTSAQFDRYRNTPFVAGRQAQIADVLADLKVTTIDLYGAAMGRMVLPEPAFCANYTECDSTTRVGAATVGVRTRVSRVGVVAELMFGAEQRESVRTRQFLFEHMMHRDVRGNFLASIGGGSPGFSIAALAGLALTSTDTSGMAVVPGTVAPAGGRRRIASHTNKLGFTAGADLTVPMGRRFGLVLPVRVTWHAKPTSEDEIGIGSTDVQVGVGLLTRLSSNVRRPQ